MCTVIVFREHGLPFPVVVAANRDEHADRPAKPLGRHWPDRPWQGGLDVVAGGTWAGVHDVCFGAYVLNQTHTLGPAPGMRSRGQLVLDLLAAGSVAGARETLLALDPASVRPCHVLLASATGVIGVSHEPDRWREIPAEPGVTMWTAAGANVADDPCVVWQRDAAEVVMSQWRDSGDIRSCLDSVESLMARPAPQGGPPDAALCRPIDRTGFGTRSSLIVAYSPAGSGRPLLVRATDGPPDRSRYRRLTVQPD